MNVVQPGMQQHPQAGPPHVPPDQQSVQRGNFKLFALVMGLLQPDQREQALFELSKKREHYPDLAPTLWHSVGVMAALLQEIMQVYPMLSPPTLGNAAFWRVVCVARLHFVHQVLLTSTGSCHHAMCTAPGSQVRQGNFTYKTCAFLFGFFCTPPPACPTVKRPSCDQAVKRHWSLRKWRGGLLTHTSPENEAACTPGRKFFMPRVHEHGLV